MDLREHILAAVAESGLSERKLSMLATGSTDTIRNIRRGAAPRVSTVEALCGVLGLELQIHPGRLVPHENAGSKDPTRTEFTGSHELPVYELVEPSREGYGGRLHDGNRAPAPADLGDEQAFYLRAPDNSMSPAQIGKSDYCLVSPCARLEVDQRAWFRDRTGRETVRWVMRLSAAGFDLGSWDMDGIGHQKPTSVHLARDDIVDRGVVLAVYRDAPVVTTPQEPVDWRPDALADLWRSALLGGGPEGFVAELDKAVSVLEETEQQLKRLVVRGTVSDVDAERIARVLDQRLQRSVRVMRSAVVSSDRVGRRAGPP